MAKKKYFLVLDVEATGLNHVYDIGYAVIDKRGNIYTTQSFVVLDIITDTTDMDTAYYRDKLPQYWRNVAHGSHAPAWLNAIRQQVLQTMKQYGINTVVAYNATYDVKALNDTIAYVTGYCQSQFFPADTIVWCVYTMACQVLFTQKTYIKQAIKKGWVTKKGNMRTSAEFAYRYITGQDAFEEEHMGLADVLVEIAIFDKCIRQHKVMVKTSIGNPWRIPQTKYKEILNSM